MLVSVHNPNLESLRFRFVPSDYQGEPSWNDDQQLSQAMDNLLVDSFMHHCVDVNLDMSLIRGLVPSSTVELLSGEDSVSWLLVMRYEGLDRQSIFSRAPIFPLIVE
jgi:hypothetical protein